MMKFTQVYGVFFTQDGVARPYPSETFLTAEAAKAEAKILRAKVKGSRYSYVVKKITNP